MKTHNVLKVRFLSMAIVIGALLLNISYIEAKTVKEELDAAKKAKKSVFLVVTATGVKTDKSLKLAQQAQTKTKGSIVISMNRDDQSNKDLVANLEVGSAPLPLIMVIGMNGIAAGGLPEKEATVDKLVKMVPSPKKVEALTHLNENKPVFIIAYKKEFSDRAKVLGNCKDAINKLGGKGVFIEVALDDPAEKAFLEQVGANFKTKSTQIIVFNSAGKNTGIFMGETDPAKLVTAAKSAPKSCCPNPTPGCGK